MKQRFEFGENWQSFVGGVTDDVIAQAERGLLRLFPDGEIAKATFLDIGCGSGLSMLAALRAGASNVHGIDLDPRSVAATRALLTRYAPGAAWSVERRSALDLTSGPTFDIVYAWGSLHHTGAMWEAVARACVLVAPQGRIALALYRRTPLCPLWRIEKRCYVAAPAPVQSAARALYKTAYLAGLVATGRNPLSYVRDYRSARGMSWSTDVHDWLGGYPYESASPEQIRSFLADKGFILERSFEHPAALHGVLGSHCDEFVARHPGAAG